MTQVAGRDAALDSGWAHERWVRILDRIEHRQLDVGLRFWGPPLWLEVTMMGPDSDRWPAISEEATSWDWQSDSPCVEAGALADDGADDDCLLAVVSRYTIENLILNAVHEIGEWFRFDGRRVFPAHRARGASPWDRDDQGNGSVMLQVDIGPVAHRSTVVDTGLSPDEMVGRLAEAAAPSRFTYLPGTSISYDAAGPVIQEWSDDHAVSSWRSSWSSATLEAIAAHDLKLVLLIARDVHSALVSHETNRICRAFHVDGSRPWIFRAAQPELGADLPDTDAPDAELLSIVIDYAQTSP